MVDVLLISLGATGGLRAADLELEGSLRRAGASVVTVVAEPPPAPRDHRILPGQLRSDYRWARSARKAARAGLRQHQPRSLLYSTCTAALFWPRAGAIRFDTTASFSRPGAIGVWQRPLERLRFRSATLLAPWSAAALDTAPGADAPAVVVPVPVEPSGIGARERDIEAVTYASTRWKKGLDRVLDAWRTARREGERLLVAGTEDRVDEPGVEVVGRLAPPEFRALLRRTRMFLTAPRREDYGIAQLEALADGCQLVTTPSSGPYVAFDLARRLDERLAGADLAVGIRAALDDPVPGYARRALEELAPFRRTAVDRVVARHFLPQLLGSSGHGHA